MTDSNQIYLLNLPVEPALSQAPCSRTRICERGWLGEPLVYAAGKIFVIVSSKQSGSLPEFGYESSMRR